MALKILLKEFHYLQECAANGCMVAPCRVSFEEMNMWNWNLSFDIVADGIVVETVDFVMVFPSDYPYAPPFIRSRHPEYRGYFFCLKGESFPSITSIIAHVYLSITDHDYYHNRGYYGPKSNPHLPSPETKEEKA
jgi:hypothetical protein